MELTVSSIYGGVKASQEADNIIIMQQVTTDHEPYLKKYLQVRKFFFFRMQLNFIFVTNVL